jgi:hypothetical protein
MLRRAISTTVAVTRISPAVAGTRGRGPSGVPGGISRVIASSGRLSQRHRVIHDPVQGDHLVHLLPARYEHINTHGRDRCEVEAEWSRHTLPLLPQP